MEPPPQSSNTAHASPKRVGGGVTVLIKKKRQRSSQSQFMPRASSSPSSVPSILNSTPCNTRMLSSDSHPQSKRLKNDDEFGDDPLLDDSDDCNDTLLCLQAYTRPVHGMTSETCAYCPIFTISSKSDDATQPPQESGDEKNRSMRTHAAPFLTQQILLHLSSNRAQTMEDVKRLALSNRIRLLQLHGTAIARNGLGCRVNGNDDGDIAVMETCAYEIASKMALQAYFKVCDGPVGSNHDDKATLIHNWFTSTLLPKFSGRTWLSSSSLEDFLENVANKKTMERRLTMAQMKVMVKELVHAGLLLPRRGTGCYGGEGYWFSLPGLGKAAKSIVDGRLSILRRIQSSKFKEKKRSTLEQDIGKPVGTSEKMGQKNGGNAMMQSGKFLVQDFLAKGAVYIHETCTGEQFVRIKE